MQAFYPESRFGGFSDLDGTIAFYARVQALLSPASVVLDFGCGRGAYRDDPVAPRRDLRTFKDKARKVIGLDVDPGAEENPFLDEFHLLSGDRWPVADASVDLCVTDNVMEHVERPELFFAEAQRVLVDDGFICIRTPNAWNYVAIVSKLIPNRAHAKVLARVEEKKKEEQDIFPTFYRCNTISKLRGALDRGGFRHVVYGYDAEPNYLAFSKVSYGLGVLYQKLCPGFLGSSLFAFGQLRKPAG